MIPLIKNRKIIDFDPEGRVPKLFDDNSIKNNSNSNLNLQISEGIKLNKVKCKKKKKYGKGHSLDEIINTLKKLKKTRRLLY